MGKLVSVTDTESAFMALSASVLSVITCLMVVISIYQDAKTEKKSYHLRLVQRLLLSDIGLSSCVIIYYIMQIVFSDSDLNIFCHIYLPTVIYFFLCSYGWTVLLAIRFRSSHQMKKAAGPPVPMYYIWLAPLPFALTVLIGAFASGDVTSVEANSEDTNQSCVFDHSSTAGIVLDLVTFQVPLLITIIVNCYSYTKGLLALSNTPHSVIARQMRKAGGYLGVLLLVWVPNIVYNFLTIFDGSDEQYNGFLDLVIFLTSLQGFLNVCVYVWSNQQMRSWFVRHVFCLAFFRKNNEEMSASCEDLAGRDPSAQNESGGSAASRRRRGDEDDSEEDEAELNESLSSGAHFQDAMPSDINNILHSHHRDEEASVGTAGSGRDTGSSKGSKTKSILIPSKQKNIDGKTKKSANVAMSADLDNERYVRFGENSTRLISMTTPRPSEDVESIDIHDEV